MVTWSMRVVNWRIEGESKKWARRCARESGPRFERNTPNLICVQMQGENRLTNDEKDRYCAYKTDRSRNITIHNRTFPSENSCFSAKSPFFCPQISHAAQWQNFFTFADWQNCMKMYNKRMSRHRANLFNGIRTICRVHRTNKGVYTYDQKPK